MTTWQKHLETAEGYLELGMFDDSAMALEEIAPEDKIRPEVLGFRVDLYMAAKKWDMGAAVAQHMVKIQSEAPGWWINWAVCARRGESVEKAEEILLRAVEVHPKHHLIRFNLACYASVMGRISEAKKRLAEAIEINGAARQLALNHPDLEPLWDSITLPSEAD